MVASFSNPCGKNSPSQEHIPSDHRELDLRGGRPPAPAPSDHLTKSVAMKYKIVERLWRELHGSPSPHAAANLGFALRGLLADVDAITSVRAPNQGHHKVDAQVVLKQALDLAVTHPMKAPASRPKLRKKPLRPADAGVASTGGGGGTSTRWVSIRPSPGGSTLRSRGTCKPGLCGAPQLENRH